MDPEERPVLFCFVSYPIEPDPDWWTEPALVPLTSAEELKQRGWIVVGPDPQDERDLAMYERLQRACPKKKAWFER